MPQILARVLTNTFPARVVENASFTFASPTNPDNPILSSYQTDGFYVILVDSAPMDLKASAPGFQPRVGNTDAIHEVSYAYYLNYLLDPVVTPPLPPPPRNPLITCEVRVTNNSGDTLRYTGHRLVRGRFDIPPPPTISIGGSGRWKASQYDFWVGTEGTVDYTGEGSSRTVSFGWDNPFIGTNSYPHREHSDYLVTLRGGSGNDAIVDYTVKRGIRDETQIIDKVMQWADKCAELRRLEPSRAEYERRVRTRIYEMMESRIPPMRFETLKEKNSELYRQLYVPIL